MKYREKKTAEITCKFIELEGGSINYTKLLKLLYILDRFSITKNGTPVTYDEYYSMPNGPNLSKTYDLISEKLQYESSDYWKKYITEPSKYKISIKESPEYEDLSKADLELINFTYKKFGEYSYEQLIDYTHQFDEYRETQSSIKIEIDEILNSLDISEVEKEHKIHENHLVSRARKLF